MSWRFWDDLKSGKSFNPLNAWEATKDFGKDLQDFTGHKHKGASAEDYLNGIPQTLQETYGPYMQHGQDAYGQLSNTYSEQLNHPSDYIQHIKDSFTSSPQYQQTLAGMNTAASNAAAAGGAKGDVGSQAHLTDILMGNDMQSWLKNAGDIQDKGTQGLQGFYDTGFNAAQNYSGDLSNLMGTQAQLGFNRASNKNQSNNDLMTALMGALGLGAGAMGGGKKSTISDWKSISNPIVEWSSMLDPESAYHNKTFQPGSQYSLDPNNAYNHANNYLDPDNPFSPASRKSLWGN